jgi:hypothetical protein
MGEDVEQLLDFGAEIQGFLFGFLGRHCLLLLLGVFYKEKPACLAEKAG